MIKSLLLILQAYKNYNSRVKSLKAKLSEKIKTLPEAVVKEVISVPSPVVDAPSPDSSDDQADDISVQDTSATGSQNILIQYFNFFYFEVFMFCY